MKLREIYSEGLLHPACLQDLKRDLEDGERSQSELARTYGVTRQRVNHLSLGRRRRKKERKSVEA